MFSELKSAHVNPKYRRSCAWSFNSRSAQKYSLDPFQSVGSSVVPDRPRQSYNLFITAQHNPPNILLFILALIIDSFVFCVGSKWAWLWGSITVILHTHTRTRTHLWLHLSIIWHKQVLTPCVCDSVHHRRCVRVPVNTFIANTIVDETFGYDTQTHTRTEWPSLRCIYDWANWSHQCWRPLTLRSYMKLSDFVCVQVIHGVNKRERENMAVDGVMECA